MGPNFKGQHSYWQHSTKNRANWLHTYAQLQKLKHEAVAYKSLFIFRKGTFYPEVKKKSRHFGK
jgi:hypothetical protein